MGCLGEQAGRYLVRSTDMAIIRHRERSRDARAMLAFLPFMGVRHQRDDGFRDGGRWLVIDRGAGYVGATVIALPSRSTDPPARWIRPVSLDTWRLQ